jgi:hypothetical protein
MIVKLFLAISGRPGESAAGQGGKCPALHGQSGA